MLDVQSKLEREPRAPSPGHNWLFCWRPPSVGNQLSGSANLHELAQLACQLLGLVLGDQCVGVLDLDQFRVGE
jgi:hypothetical protein